MIDADAPSYPQRVTTPSRRAKTTRHSLEELRARRPAGAKGGARRAEYLAGLVQADQLWVASENVGPEASPILLFYAVTQAARSLCVAGLKGDRWKTPEGHGVTCDVTAPAHDETLSLANVVVRPRGDSLLMRTSEVLESPVLERETDLGSLIASLDSDYRFDEEELAAKHPLGLRLERSWLVAWIDGNTIPLDVGPIPEMWPGRRSPSAIPPGAVPEERIVQPSSEELMAWLRDYPKLVALGQPDSLEILPELGPQGAPITEYFARMKWPASASTSIDDLWDEDAELFDVLVSGARHRPLRGYVFPAIGGNSRSMHPLITWWLILFALSMLARYYPRIWSRAIDLDKSTIAVPLRRLLAGAGSTVRELLALEIAAHLE